MLSKRTNLNRELHCGMEQRKLGWLIISRPLVRIQLPLPMKLKEGEDATQDA